MSVQARRWALLASIIGIVLAADQLSKRWIIDNIAEGELREPIPVLGEVFRITRTYNTGSAFGFLPEAGDVFLVLAVIITAGLVVFYPRIADNATLTRIATGLVCGGALGNALDRLQYEHVVDFINYRIPGFISNVSNIADHAIVLGVILIFIDSWRLDRAQKQAMNPPPATEELAVIDGDTDPGH